MSVRPKRWSRISGNSRQETTPCTEIWDSCGKWGQLQNTLVFKSLKTFFQSFHNHNTIKKARQWLYHLRRLWKFMVSAHIQRAFYISPETCSPRVALLGALSRFVCFAHQCTVQYTPLNHYRTRAYPVICFLSHSLYVTLAA